MSAGNLLASCFRRSEIGAGVAFRVNGALEAGYSIFKGSLFLLHAKTGITYDRFEHLSPGLEFKYQLMVGNAADDAFDGVDPGGPQGIANHMFMAGLVFQLKFDLCRHRCDFGPGSEDCTRASRALSGDWLWWHRTRHLVVGKGLAERGHAVTLCGLPGSRNPYGPVFETDFAEAWFRRVPGRRHPAFFLHSSP